MNNSKKLVLILIISLFLFFLISNEIDTTYNNINDKNKSNTSYTIYRVDPIVKTDDNIKLIGAQVRIAPPTALKFVGNIKDYVIPNNRKIVKYGMCIGKGNNFNIKDLVVKEKINDNNILVKMTDFITSHKNFYINVDKILKSDYVTNFTARPFILLNDGNIIYGTNTVTKNLYSVATIAKYNGASVCAIDDIIDIVSKEYKKVYFNSDMKIILDTPHIEYDYNNLKDIFLDDYKKIMEKDINTFEELINELIKVDKTCFKNIIHSTNLYKFFTYKEYKMYYKWKFLLDYLDNNIDDFKLHEQIKIIKGSSLYEDYWDNGKNLVSELHGFFTRKAVTHPVKSLDYSNMKNNHFYEMLKESIIITNRDLTDEILVKTGETIIIPQAFNNIEGLTFVGYEINGKIYKPTEIFTIPNDNLEINLIYK